jgi:hypothetical protein
MIVDRSQPEQPLYVTLSAQRSSCSIPAEEGQIDRHPTHLVRSRFKDVLCEYSPYISAQPLQGD